MVAPCILLLGLHKAASMVAREKMREMGCPIWRHGCAAVCLGSEDAAVAARKFALSDLKKQVLYSMYDASDFYLPVGAAIRKRAEKVERLAALLRSDAAAAVTARVRSHAERAAAQLRDAILAVLDGARATGYPPGD